MTKSKLHEELDRRLHKIATKEKSTKLQTVDDPKLDHATLKERARKLNEQQYD